MTDYVWRPTQEDFELWQSLNPDADYMSFWSMFSAEDYAALEADASDTSSSQPEPSESVDSQPEPEAESSTEPVYTLDEVLDILAAVQDSEEQEDEIEESPVPSEAVELLPADSTVYVSTDYTDPVEVTGLDGVTELLQSIQTQTEAHPALSTPFEDYTVMEGLLLLLLLFAVISVCIKLLKEGFSWLLW